MWKIYGTLIHEHMSSVSKQHELADIASALKSLLDQDSG